MQGRLVCLFLSFLGRNFPRVPEEASPSDQKNLERSAPSLISFDISSCLVESFFDYGTSKPSLVLGLLDISPLSLTFGHQPRSALETSYSSSNDQPSLGSCRFLITAVSITPRLTLVSRLFLKYV